MAQNTKQNGSGTIGMAFILGVLVAVVGFLAYFMLGADTGGDGLSLSIEGADTAVEKAAEAVSDG